MAERSSESDSTRNLEGSPDLDDTVERSADDSMRALLAAVAAAPPVQLEQTAPAPIDPGTIVDGAYRVLRRLGGGGMGVVYLAEHVELERRVALKLHLGSVDSQELARLRREARVMARLSDPHVLTVHGVGTHQGRMFIAMEYAEGGTLSAWLEQGPHDWRQTVGLLVQAGRGLAAAHHVGVVHRDFKPDNVLIGADGRARVADFGLARRSDDPARLTTGSVPAFDPAPDAHRFTVTGAVVGTPAYMSPEQFDGFEVGPASDQFAFCVVLYEALTGQRPFAAGSMVELADAVHSGRPLPVPEEVRVPRRLWALVARGLRPIPGDRHGSMQGLVQQLERLLTARQRRLRWIGGGTALGAALLIGNGVAVMAAPRPCEGAELQLGAAWDADRREAVVSAWPDLDPSVRGAALGALDDWAVEWGAQRREICEATRVHERMSEMVFGLRMACLDRVAARVEGLTAALSEAGARRPLDEAMVRAELPKLARCEDVDDLERLSNRFADRSVFESTAQERAQVEAEALLTRASTRMRLGRDDMAVLAEQAEAIGRAHDLSVVRSRALHLLAEDRVTRGDPQGAQSLRTKALGLAALAGSDDAAADLAVSEAGAALAAGQLDVAAVHLQYFENFASQVRDPAMAEQLRQRAQVVEGTLLRERGEAQVAIERLLPIAEDGSADVTLRVTALMELGRAYKGRGRLEEALGAWESLDELLVGLRGPEHPDLASVLNNLALVRIALDQEPRALRDLERAEAIVVAALGPEHPILATLWTNQGWAQRRLGRLQSARVLQERSLALRRTLRGDDDPSLAYPLDELGALARESGEHDRALGLLEQALTLRRAALGADHPLVAETLTRMANVQLGRGDAAAAATLVDRALTIDGEDGAPDDVATMELLMARALENTDPEQAREHALVAQARAEAAGAGGRSIGRQVQRWLDDHPADVDPK
ncbi:MAG: serine/threonine-protein kinase [Myxococcota bacterium]